MGVGRVSVADPVQESGPDDAATAPDGRHGSQVDVPVVFLAARSDLVEALCVGDNLRCVQGAAHVRDELIAVASDALGRAVGGAVSERLTGGRALVGVARK